MVRADLLVAWLDVALDHKPLNQTMYIRINLTAVKHFLGNTDLLLILLVGVGVVGIYDSSHVLEILSRIFLKKKAKVFVMIVRNGLSVLIYRTAKNGMCKLIT